MLHSCIQQPEFKLSICIPTYNRATVLRATLDTIIAQVTSDCEIVISDNASTDETQQVVAEYAKHLPRFRYVKQSTNEGFDCNTDRVVELARGEYCWLVPDDDPLKPEAIATVLDALRHDYSLVVVNSEIVDARTGSVLMPRRPDLSSDRIYGPGELDRLVRDAGEQLTYLGAVVIKRSLWLMRERKRYYGSLLAFFAVVFQERIPGSTLVMARPLIVHKFGNQSWLGNAMEMIGRWPSLVESLAVSESEKKILRRMGSMTRAGDLLLYRALGWLSWTKYQRWILPHLHSTREEVVATLIALLPSTLAYFSLLSFYSLFKGSRRNLILAALGHSRYRGKQ
jgi:abequosyltransferase